MTFLNNFQVFLKGLKGGQEVLVTISQGFVLIDEGSGFVLERLKSGMFAIMGSMRGVGDNCLDRRRGIFFHRVQLFRYPLRDLLMTSGHHAVTLFHTQQCSLSPQLSYMSEHILSPALANGYAIYLLHLSWILAWFTCLTRL